MTAAELIRLRLRNQKLAGTECRAPEEVVAWLGAVQAQEYSASKWALGLRAAAVADADIDAAFDRGALLRTHILRPTWHFVVPTDLRWMMAVSAPRVLAASASYFRKFGVDARVVRRTRAVLERALRDGNYRTRAELASTFRGAGVAADGLRLALIMMHAELDGVVCSGPRRGNQFTYALFEERVPAGSVPTREEGVISLLRRYIASRGPATIADFAWWSGLTVRETRAALEELKGELEHVAFGGRSHWHIGSARPFSARRRTAYLLPIYDEFGIAYKDRRAMAAIPPPIGMAMSEVLPHLLVIGNRLVGRWRRTREAGVASIELQPFRPLSRGEHRHVAIEAKRYGRFLRLPARIVDRSQVTVKRGNRP